MNKNDINIKYKFTLRLINALLILAIISLFYFINPLLSNVIGKVITIATPFLVALVFAMATYPLIQFLRIKFNWSNTRAKNISILLTLLSMILFFVILIPLLVQVVQDSIPSIKHIYYSSLKPFLDNQGIDISSIMKYISVSNIAGSIASVGTNFLLIIIIYLFIVFDIEKTRIFFKGAIINTKNKKVINFFTTFDRNFDNYIKALVMYSGAAIVFYGITMLLLSLPWTYTNILGFPWYMFGVLFGVLVIIPYIGPAIGIIIASLSMLKFGNNAAITMMVGIIIAMQIDGNFVQLKIIGSKMKVHPLLVISTITISSSILGFSGVLISPIILVFNKTLIDITSESIKKVTSLDEQGHAEFAQQEIDALREDGEINIINLELMTPGGKDE